MAKKNKRSSRMARVSSNSSSSRATEFEPDYTHVKNDLKRIGVLAGSFVTILVVLSFFLK